MYIPRIFKAFLRLKKMGASSKPQSPIFLWLSIKLVTEHILLIHSPKPHCKGWLLKGKRWSKNIFIFTILLECQCPMAALGKRFLPKRIVHIIFSLFRVTSVFLFPHWKFFSSWLFCLPELIFSQAWMGSRIPPSSYLQIWCNRWKICYKNC